MLKFRSTRCNDVGKRPVFIAASLSLIKTPVGLGLQFEMPGRGIEVHWRLGRPLVERPSLSLHGRMSSTPIG